MDDRIILDYETYNEVYKALKAYHRKLRKDAERAATEKFRELRTLRADRVQKLLDAIDDADTYAD